MMLNALPSVALNIRVGSVIVMLQFLCLKRVIATTSVVHRSSRSRKGIATPVWGLARVNLAVILAAIASVPRSIITGLGFVIILLGLFHCASASMFVIRKVIRVTRFELCSNHFERADAKGLYLKFCSLTMFPNKISL